MTAQSEHPSLALRVNVALAECFYRDEELPEDGAVPEDAIKVQGIAHNFGMHPTRIDDHRDEIRSLLDEMPPGFHVATGGGWSFLELCMTKDGVHWAEHPTMEALCVLGIAAKLARWCLPREHWDVLPGGMPYVQFDTIKGFELEAPA